MNYNNKTKILLTEEEIQYIQNRAIYSILNNPGFISKSTKLYIEIKHITPVHKLIFIQGNQYTGLNHIIFRHNYFSNEHSPVYSKFIETSKFHKDSHLLLDYSTISERLYLPKNLNIVRNKHPDQFDIFTACLSEFNNKEYSLILYKDTKIVHTLFPNEKNKKKKKFRRGKMIVQKVDFRTTVAVIPYYNFENIARYGFHITYLLDQKIEKLAVLVYENQIVTKVVELKDQVHTTDFNLRFRLDEIEHNKLYEIENVIDLIENGTIK